MSALHAWYVVEEAERVTRRPPKSDAAHERRGATRLPIEIDVDVEGAAHRFRSSTVDLSAGGLFVMTHHEIPVGTNVLLAFKLPNGASLEVLGVVQWRRDRHLGAESPGLGIAFFCLDPEVKKILESFCRVREALYSRPDEAYQEQDLDYPEQSGEFEAPRPAD